MKDKLAREQAQQALQEINDLYENLRAAGFYKTYDPAAMLRNKTLQTFPDKESRKRLDEIEENFNLLLNHLNLKVENREPCKEIVSLNSQRKKGK